MQERINENSEKDKEEKKKLISESFARFQTAYALSKALVEDYARMISKIEGVPEEIIIERINEKAKEIYNDLKEKTKNDFGEINKRQG